MKVNLLLLLGISTIVAAPLHGVTNPVGSGGLIEALSNAPICPRHSHSAVAIGNKMIIWGGICFYDGKGKPTTETKLKYNSRVESSGAIFDIDTQKWTDLPQSEETILTPRSGHSAIAIGSKMFVFGGQGSRQLNDGAVFDLATGQWSPLPESPLKSRQNHSAVAFGSEMIVWGGDGSDSYLPNNPGAIFDLTTNQWTLLPSLGKTVHDPKTLNKYSTDYFAQRKQHSAAVLRKEMFVYGGQGMGLDLGNLDPKSPDLLSFNLVDSEWKRVGDGPKGGPTMAQTMVKYGNKLIVFGGQEKGQLGPAINRAFSYSPETNIWSSLDSTNAPSARSFHTAVVVGDNMVVWGGYNGEATFHSDGYGSGYVSGAGILQSSAGVLNLSVMKWQK